VIRTFVDAGVLISASNAHLSDSQFALRLLAEPSRRILTSVFVRLEVYPKPTFNRYLSQKAFLNDFFTDPTIEWASDLNPLISLAMSQAERYGLAAMDSLHVAAALLLETDEFITTEKPSKPIHRVTGFRVVYLAGL
jgi:hypothetical protein